MHYYRYASRCLMINFKTPALSVKCCDYMELLKLYKSVSSCIGVCIAMGEEFFRTGIKSVDNDIMPMFELKAKEVIPRALPSYAILYWFTLKVCVYNNYNC